MALMKWLCEDDRGISNLCDKKKRGLEIGKSGDNICTWNRSGLGIAKIVDRGNCQKSLYLQ